MSDTAAIARLRAMIGGTRDGALLRVSLATALLATGDTAAALVELRQALTFDADYSAAWKLLGNTLVTAGDATGAAGAYRAGIAAAEKRGDKQACKEMTVFLKRLEKIPRD